MNLIYQSKKKLWAAIVLIITTILWGTTFIITKTITQEVPVFLYLGLRYSIALIGFAPFIIHLKKLNRRIFWMGFISGIFYFLAVAFQTLGLQTTSAGKTGFITGLNAVIVPFLAFFFFKKKVFDKRIIIAVILSVIGMGLLLLEGTEEMLIGDLLVLICAFFCAVFVVFNDKYVQLVDIYLYSIIQIITLILFCFLSSLLFRESYNFLGVSEDFWIIMFYMGVIATTLTFLFQNWGQKYQGPSQTAIIFTLEPVFAILFASFLIGNEVLTWQVGMGCILIFIAIIITVIKNDDLHNIQEKREGN